MSNHMSHHLKTVTIFVVMLLMIPVGGRAQGPVVIMGIDAEQGGPDGHGPISAYATIVRRVLDLADAHGNTGAGILVIGGGKNSTDDVTRFWEAVGVQLGESVTYVNGAANIMDQTLEGFQMIAVISSSYRVSGGLTPEEGNVLTALQPSIQQFVNNGHGGLIGFTQFGHVQPYAYLTGTMAILVDPNNLINQITPTPHGVALGIPQDELDVNHWHDVYLKYPSSLVPLALEDSLNRVVAIGDSSMTITRIRPRLAYSFHVGSAHPLGELDNQADANIYLQLDATYPISDLHEVQLRLGLAQFTREYAVAILHPRYAFFAPSWVFFVMSYANGMRVYTSTGAALYISKAGTNLYGFHAGIGAQIPIHAPFKIDFGYDVHLLPSKPYTLFGTFKLGVIFTLGRQYGLLPRSDVRTVP